MVKSVFALLFLCTILGLAGSALAQDTFGPPSASPTSKGETLEPLGDATNADFDAVDDESLRVHFWTGPEVKYCTADINNDDIIDANQPETFILPPVHGFDTVRRAKKLCHLCSWEIAEGARDCSKAGVEGLDSCMFYCAQGYETVLVSMLLTEWCECEAKP